MIREYGVKVLDGKIVACDKIKRQYEKLLTDLENPGKYHFDERLANKHIEFIEEFCRQAEGDMGAPLKLQPFQKAKFQAIFGFVDDNDLRRYNEVLTIEARKSGKTTEMAAVALSMLINDDEGSPQIYNIATAKDQANRAFDAVVKMVMQSKEISQIIKRRKSDLYFQYNMGTVAPLASNTNSLDGLNGHCIIIDELAAIKNRDIYDLMKQSMGSRSQPLLFCITTNGFLRNGIFDAQYEYAEKVLNNEIDDEKFLPFIYELDDISEWDKPDKWVKANPGLGTIKKKSYLAESVEKAKKDPSFKPTVLVKDFNLKQTAESAFLAWEDFDYDNDFDISQFDYCIGGFDAAD
ncbi:MAG TPA: terminase large subunit, partial [Candidatus Rifleibacterium sp.]|nr:terminase large subunit [Candidatus Rifleibacterium sp.]